MSEDSCTKRFYRWGPPAADRRQVRIKEWGGVIQETHAGCIGWGELVRSTYQAKPRSSPMPRPRDLALKAEFASLAETWRRDTRHYSITSQKVVHPAYLRIIAMGQAAVPLILQSLQERPAHWFSALHAITNADPALNASNPSEARDAWLEWGRAQHFIK